LCSMVAKRGNLVIVRPLGAGHGVDSHGIVAKLTVTALWPK
jgi:hypothetical protein